MSIFRYKFDEAIINLINVFSSSHKDVDTIQFREDWNAFIKDNDSAINREKFRLIHLGYTGNIDAKMYKSARYYFKNKKEKKEAKKRRKYVTLDKTFLADMDRHILLVAFRQDLKPVHAYNNFVSDSIYSRKIDMVIQNLLDDNWDEPAAECKLKKTYKNRYYIQQKNK